MKEITITWEKEKHIINQRMMQCDCDGLMKEVAYIGCIHEDGTSYLLQCEKCKTLAQVDRLPHSMNDDFEGTGWKRVTPNQPLQ